MAGINGSNAGQFSEAAYRSSGAPSGSTELQNLSDPQGRFRVFSINDGPTKEIVFAFRGVTSLEELRAVLGDSGFSHYSAVRGSANSSLDQIKTNPQFADYKIFTSGQSAGGGAAQSFAVE